MGGCHTLAFADDILIGDPLEKQVFEGIKFKQATDGTKTSSGPGLQIVQLKKYMFSSALKRMSVLAQVNEQGSFSGARVLSKGAPEVLKKFLKTVPEGYDDFYLKYVKDGARVLTLAYKNVQKMNTAQIMEYSREEAESNLIFAGFIVAECPLKPDTSKVIGELKEASHEVKMITGDNALTAAFIAQQLKFGFGPSIFAVKTNRDNHLVWHNLDGQKVLETSNSEAIGPLAKKHLLCVSGDILDQVILFSQASKIIRHIHVFSRTSPD